MLLSRVAERLYWAARYLERAEGTARIVREHSNVIVDLPLTVTPAWDHLLGITGAREGFDKRYQLADETSIVSFLVADLLNPGSVHSSIAQARENLRTCRDILPAQAWNAVNDLYLFSLRGAMEGVQRRNRSRFLERVIAEHQRLLGILTSTMSRDEAYTMLRLGRHIERADMVTRVLDVRAGLLLGKRAAQAELYDDLQWSSVLRSLSALQMYNRRSAVGDGAPEVIRFILSELTFPRSVAYCLAGVQSSARRLPPSESVLAACRAALVELSASDPSALLDADELHRKADQLQIAIGTISDRIAASYFGHTAWPVS
ncbi:MAG TPA: alpha-E domain-containing protein [Ilumatobacteraceae bacterium]|nr:alpha-E domain-containing protein [Ilumatobacteraceae bacterium]